MLFPLTKLLEGRERPLCIKGNGSLKDALALMIKHDYTQLPVVNDAGKLIGMISEQTILRRYYHLGGSEPLLALSVDHFMTRSTIMRPDDDLFDALDRLKSVPSIVVVEDGMPYGILTDYDMTYFFRDLSEGLVLVQDIEITLRQYIEDAYPDQVERDAALAIGLGAHHQDPSKPRVPYTNMTFGNTIHFIKHPQIWPKFQAALAPLELFFKLTDEARKIRNQLAHFHGGLDFVQRDLLLDTLQWLANRPRIIPPKPVEEFPDTTDISIAVPPVEHLGGRYAQLYQALTTEQTRVVTFTFAHIEQLLGDQLPPSARQHRSWWANDAATHTQAQAWMQAGWRVDDVDLTNEQVTFRQTVFAPIQLFFSDTLQRLKTARPDATSANKASLQSWFTFGAGRTGFVFGWAFSRTALRVEVIIDTGNQAVNKQLFNTLFEQREAIEQQIKAALTWERMDDKQSSRIFIERPGRISDSAEQVEIYKQWTLDMTIKFIDAFRSRIRSLP